MECPPNFGMVTSQVYRSSFPRPEHFEFLKTLGLKSIVMLLPEDYPPENVQFCAEQGIQLFQVPLSGNKEPFVHMEPQVITEALNLINDHKNQPIMVHCNQGKHRTGCVIGCFRRMQQWSLSLIFEEYRRYAYPKTRPLDQLMIERFDGYTPDENSEEYRNWQISLWS